jgi:hypothetical protein
MSTNRLPHIGASPEVIRHHLDVHPCKTARVLETECPCGHAVALICSECAEPLFLAVNSEDWCSHAEQMYRECVG